MQKGKIIGYDINDNFCQISWYNETTGEPETYEASPESFQIPTVICKRNTIWAIGIEAKRLQILHEGKIYNELLGRSARKETVKLDNHNYDVRKLLSRFIKMSLESFSEIGAIVFSVPVINEEVSKVLKEAAQSMNIPQEYVFIQDYRESFSYYMLNQPKELWQYEAGLFYCDKKEVRACMMQKIQTKIKSKSIFITVKDIAFAPKEEMDAIFPLLHGEKAREADDRFQLFIENVFYQKMVSSVYLIGEGFENNWYPNSLKLLCNGRRAFMGNNLFSKGACYRAYEKRTHQDNGYIYIDENKLTENVSMLIRQGNEEKWFPLISWGSQPSECNQSWEFLIEDTEDIDLYVESIYLGELARHEISLEEIPERTSYSTRLLVEVQVIDENHYSIGFKDLGFGDFFPASDFERKIIIELGGIHGQCHTLS